MTRGRGAGTTPGRISQLLKVAIKEQGIRIVADGVGISSSAVHRYASGIGEPTTATLEKLAAWSMRPVAWLRGESNDGGAFRGEDAKDTAKRAGELLEVLELVPERLKPCVITSIWHEREDIADFLNRSEYLYTKDEVVEMEDALNRLDAVLDSLWTEGH